MSCSSQTGYCQSSLMALVQVHETYEIAARAAEGGDQQDRENKGTFELKSFNNWIKSVLIAESSREMCSAIERNLDLKKGSGKLHVLEVGCGRGQDLKKWKEARVSYMVALDFSQKSIQEYEKRWAMTQPYRLETVSMDFTKPELYTKIDHTFYDIVSAQLCFHYMFSSEKDLKTGLSSILNNLLVGGLFIATIPDSYTILKKVKKYGVLQPDGSTVYGNQFFSVRFTDTTFTQPYGNEYGFYLEEAIGSKSTTGQIQYTKEWLVQLENLQRVLQPLGIQIQESMNFIDYYKHYRNKRDYKSLFSAFKLTYAAGQQINTKLWEIAHLYRVLVCKKVSCGRTMTDFNVNDRLNSITKEIKRPMQRSRGRGQRGSNWHERTERQDNSRYSSHHHQDSSNHHPHHRERSNRNERHRQRD